MTRRTYSFLLLVAVLLGAALRATFATGPYWQRPYSVHESDEQFLLFEPVALWEGITPGEPGWPASTTRLLLSATYGALFLYESGGKLDGSPAQAMETIAAWIAAKGEDPTSLYVVARWLSWSIGAICIAAAAWAVRRIAGEPAALVAAFLCALSPIAISYSQLVLADMTGLVFVFVLMGTLVPGAESRPLALGAAGVSLGLAVASKHHYTVWAIDVLVFCGMRSGEWGVRRAVGYLVLILLTAAVVYTAFAPWIWLNPLLALKEFAATVIGKVTGEQGPSIRRGFANVLLPTIAFGWSTVAALAFARWGFVDRRRVSDMLPALSVGVVAVFLLCGSARVYLRYGMLFFPVAVLVASNGFVSALVNEGRSTFVAAWVTMVLSVPFTAWQIVSDQRFVGALSSYALAHDWIEEHVPPGSRIAIFSEDPERYKRTRAQLTDIVARVNTPEAYAEKMATNDMTMTSAAMPMRLAVLNDELYAAFWALRELSVRGEGGYVVKRYHDDPRYDAWRTTEAIGRFLAGDLDVLVLNREERQLPPPVIVFPGHPGEHLFVHVRERAQSPTLPAAER